MSEHRANQGSVLGQVLAVTAFRNLWAAQLFSQLGFAMLLFILALRVYQLSGSNAAVSGLFLTFGIPAILFGMGAGAVVDHLDKRSVLIATDLARGVLVLAFFLFPSSLPVLYVISFLTALITQFYVPAEAPTIPRLVPSALLVTANSLFSFTYYSSLAAGSIVAGPVLRVFGSHAVFLLISSMFAIAGLLASRIPREPGKSSHLPSVAVSKLFHLVGAMVASVKDGIAYAKATPAVGEALFLLTGTQIVLAILGTLGPGFADRVLEIDVRDASFIITGPAVLGIILGSLWVGNFGYRFSPPRLIRSGITAAGVFLILIALTVRLKRVALFSWFYTDPVILPIEFLLFFFLGVANSILDVPANTMLQKEASGPMRGRVYGMLTAAVGGVGMLPIVLTGLLADVLGAGKVIFALGLIITIYGVWRMRYNKNKPFSYCLGFRN
ncbi:MFS transporter [Candidatus Gottesmanbacteria bacterium]|nr:MFS transporter [Candidatus Gottesmanbacteria bacterium]